MRLLLSAVCLTGGCSSASSEPVTLPAQGWVVFDSDRESGRHEIYLMRVDGSEARRLTRAGGKAPSWSRDGSWIAYDHFADDTVHVIRWSGAEDRKVCDALGKQSNGEYLPPFWLHDGRGILCGDAGSYYAVNPETAARELLFRVSDFPQLASFELTPGSITHDGRWLAALTTRYREGYQGDNGGFVANWASVLLDLQDRSKLYFIGLGCEPTTPPTGDLVYHVCGSANFCPNGFDIARMSTRDAQTRSSYRPEIANRDADWGHEYFPRISNDNRWLSYGASQGCHDHDLCDYEIFIHPLGGGDGQRVRLTREPANDRWPHLFVGVLPGQAAPALDAGAVER